MLLSHSVTARAMGLQTGRTVCLRVILQNLALYTYTNFDFKLYLNFPMLRNVTVTGNLNKRKFK